MGISSEGELNMACVECVLVGQSNPAIHPGCTCMHGVHMCMYIDCMHICVIESIYTCKLSLIFYVYM